MGIMAIMIDNLEKVGFGALLFLMAYVSNMLLGAWWNVKIEGFDFDWMRIANSAVKFIVLGIGIALLSVVVSVLPAFMTYVGIEIADETMQVLDSVVIISAFIVACSRYVKDAYDKLKEILA